MTNPDVTSNTEQFVKGRLSGEGTGHDWWHVERVRNIAQRIHGIEGGEHLIIDLALLLHDSGDRKVIKKDDDDYSIAEEFLALQDIPQEQVDRIMSIIKTMSFSKSFDETTPKDDSIERAIVQDADRLDAIGAIGIARAFAFGGSRGRLLYDPDSEAQTYVTSEDYKKSTGSTLHHFAEKLLLIKDMLNTDEARKIAKERDAYMRAFVAEFLAEWNGQK